MDIRTAILKAADQIKSNPGSYDFQTNGVHPCGTPMCMLGHVGVFRGAAHSTFFSNSQVMEIIGADSLDHFIDRCDAVCAGYERSPVVAARTLRLYADKYHQATKQDLPASVRNIFDMTPGELAEALSA